MGDILDLSRMGLTGRILWRSRRRRAISSSLPPSTARNNARGARRDVDANVDTDAEASQRRINPDELPDGIARNCASTGCVAWKSNSSTFWACHVDNVVALIKWAAHTYYVARLNEQTNVEFDVLFFFLYGRCRRLITIVRNLSRTTVSECIYLQMKAVDLINGEFCEGTEYEVAIITKH